MTKVMIVEDNELNLKLFCDLLTIRECDLVVSKDGTNVTKTALQKLPDLILMDIQLNSEFSGIELIRELKNNDKTKHIPIIAITAFAMKTEEEAISKSGCDMYLPKPVSIDNFYQAIDTFINPNDDVN